MKLLRQFRSIPALAVAALLATQSFAIAQDDMKPAKPKLAIHVGKILTMVGLSLIHI